MRTDVSAFQMLSNACGSSCCCSSSSTTTTTTTALPYP